MFSKFLPYMSEQQSVGLAMLSHICLLAVISSAFAIPSKLSEVRVLDQVPEAKENSYGVVGGESADITKYPYTVGIYSDYLDRLLGGGAILNQNWIVCSAYQLMGLNEQVTSVRAGSNNAGNGGQYVNVSKLIRHERFDLDYPYDIALLKTVMPIKLGKEAKAVKLAKAKPKDGTVAQVTGYGKSLDPSETVMNLKAANVKVISQTECEKHHRPLDTSFCADSDGVGPCSSDIGDPLVYNNILIGFYIGGDTCNYHGVPDLYTDVSALRQWIEGTIKKNSKKEEMEGLFSIGNDDSN